MIRWLRATLIANGVRCRRMPLGTALDVAQVLVATGRAIPPSAWVDELIALHEREKLEALF